MDRSGKFSGAAGAEVSQAGFSRHVRGAQVHSKSFIVEKGCASCDMVSMDPKGPVRATEFHSCGAIPVQALLLHLLMGICQMRSTPYPCLTIGIPSVPGSKRHPCLSSHPHDTKPDSQYLHEDPIDSNMTEHPKRIANENFE